jgi:hypothetical protein
VSPGRLVGSILVSLLLAAAAFGTKTRLRLERIDTGGFAESGRVRVYASMVELEGDVVEQQPGAAFRLTVDGSDAGAAEKVAPFAAAGEALDLVLVVESSALYGPPVKTVALPPPPAPIGKHDKKKRGKPVKAPAPPPPPIAVPSSEEAPLEKVKEAASQLLEGMSPKWRVLVIEYASEVTAHPPFRPAAAASGAVEELQPDDEASELRLTDALRAALAELGKTPERRKLIVVVSDGISAQMERRSFRALGDAAAKAHVPIHSIAFSPNDDRLPLLNLGELSKRSNGTFRWARSAADLRKQIETLADELTKQYVLTYKLDARSLDGKTFLLSANGISSNPLRFEGHAKRTLAWWIYAAPITLLVLLILALAGRGRRKREPAPIAVLEIASGARAGQRFPIGKQPLLVGKEHLPDDPSVSTRHAQFQALRDGFVITDLGSTNGTWVNNQRIAQPTRLSDGDVVRLGTTQLRFRVVS